MVVACLVRGLIRVTNVWSENQIESSWTRKELESLVFVHSSSAVGLVALTSRLNMQK